MEKNLTKIDSSTLVPIGLVGSCVVILVGGVFWLSNVNAATSQTKDRVLEIEYRQERIKDSLDRIDRRLSRIEGKLGINEISKED